jgi:hypothetical protein|tara:strand:- start:6662 stop:6847 length:186 start_codon:yes stop_codon:yes gene_type:complete
MTLETIERDIGRIEGKLDTVLLEHTTRLQSHEHDINVLKRWRTGVAAVIATVLTATGITLK